MIEKFIELPQYTYPIDMSLGTTYAKYLAWIEREFPKIKKVKNLPGGKFEYNSNNLGSLWLCIEPGEGCVNVTGEYTFFAKSKSPNENWGINFCEHSKNTFPLVEITHNKTAGIYDDYCVQWAKRPILVGNMENFLSDIHSTSGVFLSKKQFQVALRDAHKRGIIGKTKTGRFVSK